MLKTIASAAISLAAAGVLLLAVAGTGPVAAQTSDLVSKQAFRVCADPANLPMSDRSGAGFENKIAELMASRLELPLEYTWFPMATGFIRKTLQANACDVVIGYAQGDELVLNTNHYYTSAYVLIVPSTSPLAGVTTLADPLLKDKRIGVIAGTPPATHVARNGLMPKAKGYHLMVDRRYEDPADDMLADLKSGAIDAAILWGPIGAPLVKASHPDLKVTPLLSEPTPPKLFYRITMGVRQGEKVWERKLNSLIRRNQSEINAILAEAGVPLMNDMGTGPLELPK
ncbi:amino acid ABC transporter substrate-binding protein [Sinorhizobium fredii]|uniref:Amino acid ABC transporter substrate-binding protein n=2 Tax=Rhizobium fredii TaxID=380 RepID=A0A2A6LQR6_RHIFR|nr:amino acid ABC transporter substrate-binding protein [Sinorhizobium fredii]